MRNLTVAEDALKQQALAEIMKIIEKSYPKSGAGSKMEQSIHCIETAEYRINHVLKKVLLPHNISAADKEIIKKHIEQDLMNHPAMGQILKTWSKRDEIRRERITLLSQIAKLAKDAGVDLTDRIPHDVMEAINKHKP